MKKIKLNFVDFWDEFNKTDNFIYNILKEYFEVEISDMPDYVICSCFGKDYLKYNCVRIQFIGENLCPDFNSYDYAIGFSLMDFGDRYLRCPIYVFYEQNYKLALKKHLFDLDSYVIRDKFCNFVVSNSISDSSRDNFFDLCNSIYKKIDSGGRYRNNIHRHVVDKLAFQREYKFSIAFENTSTPGYVTEKIVDAFAAGTVPIYWGDPDVVNEFNSKAFINCYDYDSFEKVIQRIEEIDNDDKLYLEMLQQPIYNDNSRCIKYNNRKAFIEFFDNIFRQDLNSAYRRNRVFWGKQYEEDMRRYRIVDKVFGFFNFKKKILRIWFKVAIWIKKYILKRPMKVNKL